MVYSDLYCKKKPKIVKQSSSEQESYQAEDIFLCIEVFNQTLPSRVTYWFLLCCRFMPYFFPFG